MKSLLSQLVSGQTLSVEQAESMFEHLMSGQGTAAQWGAALAMIQMRGPTVDELTGAAKVMRDKSVKVQVPAGLTVVDTCGTGGDHTPTFNISTAAALVAAAAGRPRNIAVAKHGNRTVTRASGSSQGLEALGVRLDAPPEVLSRCLDEVGFCFCFAPAHHPAMKHAMPIRQELGFRTIFNLLGPLTNPAGARRQLLGVFDPDLCEPLTRVLAKLGSERAMVVHGLKGDTADAAGGGPTGGGPTGVGPTGGGFCELSACGPSVVSELRDGEVRTYELDAESLGLRRAPIEALLVADPQQSAAVMRRVFAGQGGPQRDIVCLNAAAALVLADAAADLTEGLNLAAEAIDSGAVSDAVDRLAAITRGD